MSGLVGGTWHAAPEGTKKAVRSTVSVPTSAMDAVAAMHPG